jgi:hypothetical protein
MVTSHNCNEKKKMAILPSSMLLLLVAPMIATATHRDVSFWYGVNSYGGEDINNTINVLRANKAAVTSVML